MKAAGGERPGVALILVRVGLPLLIAIVGGVMIAIGHGGDNSPVAVAGLVLVGVAVMVWMLNWMFRASVESNDDREREGLAREYYLAHGHWPDEPSR
jgi:threonine/homoserine/homoserine lactone efflux protein